MNSVFLVCPLETGWCVKVCDSGEVLQFATGGEAERRARALASSSYLNGAGEVWVQDRDGRLVGRWIDGGLTPAMGAVLLDDPEPVVYLAA